jgi:catechol 2,3-dioxygenase-like lactoylglutathione lyase family enzyme
MLSDQPMFTTLPASDLERARKFYKETLGFEVESEDPGGTLFRAGDGARFLVFPSAGKASGDHTQAGWRVTGIRSVMDELRGRGVEFLDYDLPGFKTENGVAQMGDVLGAWFKDTEGNLLNLTEG